MKAPFFLKRNPSWFTALLAIAVVVILGSDLSLAHAWVAPTATPPNGDVGLKVYVTDCAAYATNGWANKNECLQDGRWHKVQSNGPWGAFAAGDLATAISNGADVKTITTGSAYFPANGTYITLPAGQAKCTNVFVGSDGYAVCQDPSRYAGNTDNTSLMSGSTVTGNKNLGVAIYKGNGILTCVSIVPSAGYGETITGINGSGCGPYVQAALDWYVRY